MFEYYRRLSGQVNNRGLNSSRVLRVLARRLACDSNFSRSLTDGQATAHKCAELLPICKWYRLATDSHTN